jgi:hypothetical protein
MCPWVTIATPVGLAKKQGCEAFALRLNRFRSIQKSVSKPALFPAPIRMPPAKPETLLEHGLADEIVLIVYPALLGTGKRLFAEDTPPRCFELVGTNTLPSGIIISTYKVAGPLKTG